MLCYAPSFNLHILNILFYLFEKFCTFFFFFFYFNNLRFCPTAFLYWNLMRYTTIHYLNLFHLNFNTAIKLISRLQEMSRTLERRAEGIKAFFEDDLKKVGIGALVLSLSLCPPICLIAWLSLGWQNHSASWIYALRHLALPCHASPCLRLHRLI